jgi:hypothetical protein
MHSSAESCVGGDWNCGSHRFTLPSFQHSKFELGLASCRDNATLRILIRAGAITRLLDQNPIDKFPAIDETMAA